MSRNSPEAKNRLRRLFVRDGRLRSGWRVASFAIVKWLLLLFASLLVGVGYSLYFFSRSSNTSGVREAIINFALSPTGLFIFEIVQLAILLAVVYLWRHALDQKSLRSLGLQLANGWWKKFLLGAGLIALTWTAIFIFALFTSIVAITNFRVDAVSALSSLGWATLFNLLVGVSEELEARGYVLQNLSEGVGFPRAVVVSALYFGALHLTNPGANASSALGTALFGVLAAVAYWATGDLWMPIGMHAAWNFFEGPVFGFLVSGLDLGGLFQLRVNGPEWLIGGSFGPEAGALTMAPQVILILLLLVWGRNRQRSISRD